MSHKKEACPICKKRETHYPHPEQFQPEVPRVPRPKEHPLSAEETANFAMGDPFKEHGQPDARHENAAGKKLCGMCGHKAAGKIWRCTEPQGFPCPNGAHSRTVDPNWICPGFSQKPLRKKGTQGGTECLPVPPGVKFLYIGAPQGKTKKGVPQHKGVVTVAYSIAEKSHLVEISFAFTNMGDPKLLKATKGKEGRPDPYCKSEGRNQAVKKLKDNYLTVPYLYDAKRMVHEVVRAVLNHDWETLYRTTSYVGHDVKPFQRSVPGWTKGLAKRMGHAVEAEKNRQAAKIWHKIVNQELCKAPFPDFLGGIYIAPPTRDLPFNIMARMMRDIAALGND